MAYLLGLERFRNIGGRQSYFLLELPLSQPGKVVVFDARSPRGRGKPSKVHTTAAFMTNRSGTFSAVWTCAPHRETPGIPSLLD
jgi:hypothetical protein